MSNYYGFSGYGILGATTVFLQPGADGDRPRNIQWAYPVGNRYGRANYGEGAQFPVFRLPVVLMASYFTAANWNAWFLTHAGAQPHDLSAIGGGVEFADVAYAADEYKMNGAKGAGFNINFRFGQPMLTAQCEFHGTSYAAPAGPPAAVVENPLTFAEVTLSGAAFGTKAAASKGILGGAIVYNNGLTPNEQLNGTHYPSAHNADAPTAQLQIQMYADPDNPPPGYTDKDTFAEITDCGVHFKIGAATYTSFTFPRLILNNPNARRLMGGRGIRTFVYDAAADASNYPLACAAT